MDLFGRLEIFFDSGGNREISGVQKWTFLVD